MVEDDNGCATLVSPEALTGLFELVADHIECVLLNACYSQPQADAIIKHIAYVIGMNTAIEDSTAIEFAVGFYDALGGGKSVKEAFKFGNNALQFYRIPEHLKPVLKEKSKNFTRVEPQEPTTHIEIEIDKMKEVIESDVFQINIAPTEQVPTVQHKEERSLDAAMPEEVMGNEEKINQKGGFHFKKIKGDIHIKAEGDIVGGDKIETTGKP